MCYYVIITTLLLLLLLLLFNTVMIYFAVCLGLDICVLFLAVGLDDLLFMIFLVLIVRQEP